MEKRHYSDDILNAFVDGELETEDAIEVLKASEDDDEVRTRLCELRYLKEMVAHAYSDVPRPHAPVEASRHRLSGGPLRAATAAAMVAVLAVGIGIGWVSQPQHHMAQRAPDTPVFMDISEVFSLQEAKEAHGAPSSIVLHVTTNDAQRIEDALTKLDKFVASQRVEGSQQKVAVEIVANGFGLDLIRAAQTPYEDRVKSLARDEYVTLLACRLAVQRLRDRGVDVELIPEAEFARSALDRIIDRLREGWVYVKV